MPNEKDAKPEPTTRSVKVSEETHRRLKIGAGVLGLTFEQTLDLAVEKAWPEWQKRVAKA